MLSFAKSSFMVMTARIELERRLREDFQSDRIANSIVDEVLSATRNQIVLTDGQYKLLKSAINHLAEKAETMTVNPLEITTVITYIHSCNH